MIKTQNIIKQGLTVGLALDAIEMQSKMRESKYQAKLIKKFKKLGYTVVKITVCNLNGFPDLMLLKNGRVEFIEVKGDGGRLSEIQKYRIEQLRSEGFNVGVMRPGDEEQSIDSVWDIEFDD